MITARVTIASELEIAARGIRYTPIPMAAFYAFMSNSLIWFCLKPIKNKYPDGDLELSFVSTADQSLFLMYMDSRESSNDPNPKTSSACMSCGI